MKKKMKKFDFVIGNPPYQDETIGENVTFAPPVYNLFLDSAYEIGTVVEMIHPARFLFNAGSTPKSWNEKMLNNTHFKVLKHISESSDVFPNTNINGGVVITYHDSQSSFKAIEIYTPFIELNEILHKVRYSSDFLTISSIVFTRTSYRLSEKLHLDYPEAIKQLSNGHAYDVSSNIFERLPQVFFKDVPQDGKEYVRLLGRENNERTFKYIRKDYLNDVINLEKYKIVMSQADGAAGSIGHPIPARIIGTPSVLPPKTGTTESFISIGAFDTKDEAQHALKYIKTRITRTLLGVLKVTQAISPVK